MTMHWLVSGVARSGTTALYLSLQSYLARPLGDFTFRYEPYLWGPPIWDKWDFSKADFQHTGSLYVPGIYAHTQTPLFGEELLPGDPFTATVFPPERPVLAKMIRGSGRLSAWLAAVPELKVVHVIRNPLDVVNSALGRFSVFGGEFHPTDYPRFRTEVSARFGKTIEPGLTAAQRTAAWWQFMNEAALDTARAFPERVLVVCQESFARAPAAVFAEMCTFFGREAPPRDEYRFGLKGSVAREILLKSADVEALRPLHDAYFAKLQAVSAIPLHFDPHERAAEVVARYRRAKPGAFAHRVSTEFTPLYIRRQNADLREQVETLDGRREFLDTQLQEARRTLRATQNLRKVTYKRLDEQIKGFRDRRPVKMLSRLSREFTGDLDQIDRRARILSGEANISCIVTSYNNGPALLHAVQSIRIQAVSVREIIVADDGSSDGSLEAVIALAEDAPEIRIVRRERNLGPALNRHQAILDAQGAFITTLDGDDQFGPFKLAEEWHLLRGRRDRVVFSNHARVNPDGTAQIVDTRQLADVSASERVAALALRSVPVPRDFLYSKELYRKAGGYDPQIWLYEDWSLKMRLAAVAGDWVHADCLGTLYQQHDAGLSSVNQWMHAFWKLAVLAGNEDVLFRSMNAAAVADVLSRALAHVGDEALREKLQGAISTRDGSDSEARSKSFLRGFQSLKAAMPSAEAEHVQRLFQKLVDFNAKAATSA